jgi:CRISPR-associated protein Cmr5
MGLGQTIAFYRAKAEPHHNRLAGALEAWVLNDTAPHDDVQSDDTQPGTAKSDQPPGKALLDAIMESSSAQYRQWTNEVLAYLTWLKRFAEAEATS